jgi:hypothetical protein
MNRTIVTIILLLTVISPLISAEEQQKHGHKWKAIMTAVGAGGGFVLGAMYGLSAYDDSINSDQKVTTAATIGCATGGTLGFLLGWRMDNSRRAHEVRLMPEIRWKSTTPVMLISRRKSDSGLLRDADPIELLARAAKSKPTQP